jgi:hypothetical protein
MLHYGNIFVIRSQFSRPIIDSAPLYGFRILSIDQINEQNLLNLYRVNPTTGGISPFSNPPFIKWIQWRTFSWDPAPEDPGMFSKIGLPEGAFHLIKFKLDLIKMDPAIYARDPLADYLVLDIEQPLPEFEVAQKTFPELLDPKDYYDGIALSYTQPMSLAKSRFNWRKVSLFGLNMNQTSWSVIGDPDQFMVDELDWSLYSQKVHEGSDTIHPSVYLTRWSARNIAASLSYLDSNWELVKSYPPGSRHNLFPFLRPMYLSSGTACDPARPDKPWNWFKDLPIPDEEARAMTVAAFFSDIKGFGVWSSHRESPNGYLPGSMTRDRTFLVERDKRVIGLAGASIDLKKYDVIFVRERRVEGSRTWITFEVMPKPLETMPTKTLSALKKCIDHKDIDGVRIFTASEASLLPLLRAETRAIAAIFEGMALIQPIEYLVFTGQTIEEVSPRVQFGKPWFSPVVNGLLQAGTPATSIVRHKRVTYNAPDASGDYNQRKVLHLVFTYDPQVLYKVRSSDTILLKDFAGVAGRTLKLRADAQPRIYLFEE